MDYDEDDLPHFGSSNKKPLMLSQGSISPDYGKKKKFVLNSPTTEEMANNPKGNQNQFTNISNTSNKNDSLVHDDSIFKETDDFKDKAKKFNEEGFDDFMESEVINNYNKPIIAQLPRKPKQSKTKLKFLLTE